MVICRIHDDYVELQQRAHEYGPSSMSYVSVLLRRCHQAGFLRRLFMEILRTGQVCTGAKDFRKAFDPKPGGAPASK